MTSATPPETAEARGGILGPQYLATTIGMFALIAFNAFEALALTTVMPTISRDLDGVGLYALAFAAPLASGVIGMVASGLWSDRRGPVTPLVASMVLFSAGLVVCGFAPSMEVLVAGRVLQGLGGGALTVGLYVVVGLCYPAALQPSVFASFAAAWVLPSLFGPAVAALVADTLGWRWLFLGVVLLIVLAAALIAPALRTMPDRASSAPQSLDAGGSSRLAWAVLAAVAVLVVELLGSQDGPRAAVALLPLVLVVVAVRPLVPPGTLRAARGLPAVIGTRGLMSAGFFCAQAYIAFALQELWALSPGRAGIALTVVGVVWATASQVQAFLGDRVGDRTAMRAGALLVLLGTTFVLVVVRAHDAVPAAAAMAAYAVAGAGMGFGYPRTSVAMLAASSDTDRGFNASALTIADSLGAALALSVSGVAFAAAERTDHGPFLAVYVVAVVCAAAAVVTAGRTRGREHAHPAAPVPG